MDQESIAIPGMVNKLMSVIDKHKNVGFVASFPINKFYNLKPPNNNVHKVDKVITSGNLLKLDTFQTAGSVREDLFIAYVDFESKSIKT